MTPEGHLSREVSLLLRSAGCDVVVVRDTTLPGPSDLLVEWEAGHLEFHVWIELKVDAPLRAEQRNFLAERYARYRNAYLLHFDRHGLGVYYLYPGNAPLVRGRELWYNTNLRHIRTLLKAIEDNR